MKIAILGCGNMGLAYAHSFLKYNLVTPENLLLVEKSEHRAEQLSGLNIGKITGAISNEMNNYDVIILSVKPQDFSVTEKELSKVLTDKNLVLSIMAGKKISYISQALKHDNIVRAMPNSPAQLGMGITAYTAAEKVNPKQLRMAENLLNSTGRSVYLEDENLLDAVTALSGSGPAYFFYFVQQMTEAGVKLGIEPSVASMLVKQTMLGSFHLLNQATQTPEELIKAVASKGGTTEAAFNVFSQKHFGEILQEAIAAAESRAKELSSVK
jgi:pyrroline-5-carboxylate reductase